MFEGKQRKRETRKSIVFVLYSKLGIDKKEKGKRKEIKIVMSSMLA